MNDAQDYQARTELIKQIGFTRWMLMNFTSREHYVRFLALVIMLTTVYFVVAQVQTPDGWWGIFGMVIGYFFRGTNEPEKKPE